MLAEFFGETRDRRFDEHLFEIVPDFVISIAGIEYNRRRGEG